MNADELLFYITDLLRGFCENGEAIEPDTELLESGLLDSYAFLQLLTSLEDAGCEIQPTQHPSGSFATARSIAAICAESENERINL